MPLDEGASAGVLPGQSDWVAIEKQRADRDQLTHRPVDRVVVNHRGASLELWQQPRVGGEPYGQIDLRVRDFLQDVDADRSCQSSGDAAGAFSTTVGSWGALVESRGLGERLLEVSAVVAKRGLGLVERDVAAPDERLGVELAASTASRR